MNFVFKMMDFVSKMMNFVFKMMNFVSKMMNFVFKMMNVPDELDMSQRLLVCVEMMNFALK